MTQLHNTEPIVVTLDAGGTNFVFGAMQGGKACIESITMPSNAYDLDLCLSTLIKGFEQVIASLEHKPVAISFAFPGPADYRNGIIGGFLPNFPSFRDGVALGPMLEEHFGVPVFILCGLPHCVADAFYYALALFCGKAEWGLLTAWLWAIAGNYIGCNLPRWFMAERFENQ